VSDTRYRAELARRLTSGDLPPALECMVWHYAWGRPAETVDDLEDPNGGEYRGPITFVIRARSGAAQ
jgi:hypothetical protein